MNKRFFFFLFLFWAAIASLTSCHTQTFTVHGQPGTVISYNGQRLAVIDQSGEAQITAHRENGYQYYYLAQAPGSNVALPFALDYEDRNRVTVFNACLWLGPPTLSLSLFISGFALYGSDMLNIGSDYDPNTNRVLLRQQYDYLKHQSTNNDLIR